MTLYRNALPQLSGNFFLTDGGLETTLIFHEGINLPGFASFVLLENEKGRDILREYYRRYANIAQTYDVGFILESITWRNNNDWGKKLGYSSEQITDFDQKSIELLQGIRSEYKDTIPHMVISGCIGPRGDGYSTDISMTASEAEIYHHTQILNFKTTKADMVTAYTIPYISEGIGIALAAKSAKMPVVIGFTVETDGRLPSGELLKDAIEQVDAATNYAPAYYMINCAHPSHFDNTLDNGSWTKRIRAIRANASTKSHAELDAATELDDGNPQELSASYIHLEENLENLNIFGGCCGTDHRHIEEICKTLIKK